MFEENFSWGGHLIDENFRKKILTEPISEIFLAEWIVVMLKRIHCQALATCQTEESVLQNSKSNWE